MLRCEHRPRQQGYRQRHFHCIHAERETVKDYPSGMRKERCKRCLHFIMVQPDGTEIRQLSFIDVLIQ